MGIYPGGNYGRYCSICKDELGDYEFTLSNKFRDVDYCEDCCFSDTADINELYFYEGPPKGGYAHTCEHGEDSYALDEHYLIKYDNFIYFDPTGDPNINSAYDPRNVNTFYDTFIYGNYPASAGQFYEQRFIIIENK